MTEAEPFAAEHYLGQVAPSRGSAAVVLPLVLELLNPKSVLDVGCGAGSWLATAQELGVGDLLGIEGGHPRDEDLQVPRETIVSLDLRQPIDLGRRFDLLISVEVAEHLPAEDRDVFLQTISTHGDALLFSAAIPGQGGFRHVNEQWPTYWADALRDHDFDCFDPWRLELWDNSAVEWWYRQNLLLFVRGEARETVLGQGLSPTRPRHLVHPELFEMLRAALTAQVGVKTASSLMAQALTRRVSRSGRQG